jgi:endonuclease/exonuclease/phosphatase family metal-dependent hydrolase
VASLNLHCGFGFFGRSFDVPAALCQLDADVVCVQETWLPTAGELAPADCPDGGSPGIGPDLPADPGLDEPWAEGDSLAGAARKLGAVMHRVVMCRPRNLRLSGVPISSGPGELAIGVLTTLPVSGYEVIDLGVAPADDVPRFAQAVTLELASGTSVRVVNTHLTHRLTSPLQLRSLQQRLRADASSREVPTVIVGDLNMPWPVAALSTSYKATVRGKTWPAGWPLVQLDHILAGKGIRVQESCIMPPAGSDHLPVRACLRVLPPRLAAQALPAVPTPDACAPGRRFSLHCANVHGNRNLEAGPADRDGQRLRSVTQGAERRQHEPREASRVTDLR